MGLKSSAFLLSEKPLLPTRASMYEFDEQQLDKLAAHDSNGEPLLEVLVKDFYGSSHTLLKALSQSAEAGDIERLKDCAHSLRSPAQTLGLSLFAKACEDLEKAPGSELELKSQVRKIKQRYLRACIWLNRQTKSTKAA